MLTLEQKACNYETREHISRVSFFIHKFIKELIDRADGHDKSKLDSPEVEIFTEFTPKLAHLTYGSKEYDECTAQMKVALDHHYAKNRHHIQHHKLGIEDMNLVDIIEMFCDWRAATERHHDGNLCKSISIQASKHNINPQLVKIFENSVELFE